MKKLLLAFLLMGCTPAAAGVPCSLPFNLQNGTPADATQVMANYNALVTCLSSAAAAGANSDITSLTGLTTPISPSVGGTQTFVATAPSTGPANAQIVSITTPTGFQLVAGFSVVFVAGATNTAGMTLQVGTATAAAVYRRTTDGLLNTAGGEVINGTLTVVTYDGVRFQLLGTQLPIGSVIDTIYPSADPGFLLLNGQCVSTTLFGALYAKLGSPAPGACGAGNWPLPDARGRVIAMIDSGGSNRITVAGGNFDGTVLGIAGGLEYHLMTSAELVSHTHTNSLSDPGHVHPGIINNSGLSVAGPGVAAPNTSTTNTGSATTGITINNAAAGGGQAFTVLQPTLMLNRQVKF